MERVLVLSGVGRVTDSPGFAAARWGPWYPFLVDAHHGLVVSLPALEERAAAHGVTVTVLTASPATDEAPPQR